MRRLFLFMAVCLGLSLGLSASAFAQVPEGYAPGQTYGMAAKKPVLAGACAFCPWGAIADIVKAAAKSTSWDVQVCYNCSGANSIRLPAGHKLPPLRSPVQISEGSPPPPYGLVDFGVSAQSFLHDAYLGVGTFKGDGPYKNLRLIAVIEHPSYLVVAVKKSSGITDLAEIKAKKMPVRIYTSGAGADTILAYYGLTREALESWGGSIGPSGGGEGGGGARGANPPGTVAPAAGRANAAPLPENRGGRATRVQDFDVYIHGYAIMANNPESNLLYQVTQIYELNFLQLPEDLLNRLAEYPMQRVVMPQAYFAGVERNISTVGGNYEVVFCRDDAPDGFSYDIAKALDQHKDLLKWAILPYSYNPATVGVDKDVPLAPGAARYYREAGYIK
jgi:TRAP-type uncharacterized transport system substrate-binding protein